MSRMFKKRRSILIVLVLVIPLLFNGCGEKNGELEEETQIFEIENTEEIYNYSESKTVSIYKHYMVINPPEDLHELKIIVEKFYKDNSLGKEIVVEENKQKYMEVLFYRESKKLPRDWQPDEGYLSTDRIEDHNNDLIAVIYWSDSPPHNTYYSILRRSSNKGDYGELMERIRYIDDEIEEREVFDTR